MVDRRYPSLSIVRQCELLGVSRSSLYYQPKGISEEDLTLMKLIDCKYLSTPFYGARKMAAWLKSHAYSVNRKRVRRLMRLMGLKAIYRRPRTSKPTPGHKTYPYLLGGIAITRPNQVWAADITYIPMARGFLYLVVNPGLVQSVCALLAPVKHPGCRLLRRCSGGGAQEGGTGHLQYRPGCSVHWRVLHQTLAATRSQDQHGWEKAV